MEPRPNVTKGGAPSDALDDRIGKPACGYNPRGMRMEHCVDGTPAVNAPTACRALAAPVRVELDENDVLRAKSPDLLSISFVEA